MQEEVVIPLSRVGEKLEGYKLTLVPGQQHRIESSWRFSLLEEERLLRVFSQEQAEGVFQPTSLSGTNLMYKFLDQNVFGVLTQVGEDNMNVYLISSVTGSVVYKYKESKVDFNLPIVTYYLENMLIVTFSRTRSTMTTQQEIAVTELFKPKLESDTYELLKKAYLESEEFNQKSFDVYAQESPLSVRENYVFP